jgi:hypothetical protein
MTLRVSCSGAGSPRMVVWSDGFGRGLLVTWSMRVVRLCGGNRLATGSDGDPRWV